MLGQAAAILRRYAESLDKSQYCDKLEWQNLVKELEQVDEVMSKIQVTIIENTEPAIKPETQKLWTIDTQVHQKPAD